MFFSTQLHTDQEKKLGEEERRGEEEHGGREVRQEAKIYPVQLKKHRGTKASH